MFIDPSAEQFQVFKSLDRDKPVNMLNLVRLRDEANYEDGRGGTGAEAYAAYGKNSAPIFARVGGEIIWRGDPKAMVIGPLSETWHIAFIARYPSLHRFLEMVKDPDYQTIVFHRQAGVLDSRLIAHHEMDSGGGFG